MNARRFHVGGTGAGSHLCPRSSLVFACALVLLGLCALWSTPSHAWSLDDPLDAMPPVIQSGERLPGDDSSAPCPVHKNFAIPLTLSEAVDLTLCNNPKIRMAWANIKVQANALGEARTAYLPTLSSSVGRLRDKTTYPGYASSDSTVTDNTVTGTLRWRLFDFGGRAANRRSAADLLAAALDSQDATLQKILSTAVQAYFDAFTARATVAAKTQDEAIATQTLAAAKNREHKGAASNSDVLQAVTALAKASLDKNRARGAYSKALSVLVYTMGVPGETQVFLPKQLSEPTRSSLHDLHSWLAIAQQDHPAILQARAQLAAARNKVDAARAQGRPTLDFAINYYQNGRPGQSLTPVTSHETTIGVVLTIPLFEGFARTYKIEKAQAQADEKAQALVDEQHQIVMSVVKAYADADSALHNLQASDDLLHAALNALAVTEHKYKKGAADIIELLHAQSALADAEQQRIQCLDDWRSSRLKLLASAGELNHSAINP